VSFYNMMFGMNRQADLLLAVIGLKRIDIERFRDVFASDDGTTITVYTRTGGGNREDYPNLVMRKAPGWTGTHDDEGDSTYAWDTFRVPAEFVNDVRHLPDVLSHGLRPEFCHHLQKTLQREPNQADLDEAIHNNEAFKLGRVKHFMANGHTFVPMDDTAMQVALELAEANGGKLRTCWGILPLALTVETNKVDWPNHRDPIKRRLMTRVRIDPKWEIDDAYWSHCCEVFANEYPTAMHEIAQAVAKQRAAKR